MSNEAPRVENADSTRGTDRPASSRTVAWVSTTYFAEGLPYMIVRILSGVYFTDVGAKERYIGYLNFLGIPWNLKFLWAPLVDAISTKRTWLIFTQALITLITGVIAGLCLIVPGGEATHLLLVALLFVGMAFVAATNDIAIDGHYLEAITSPADQAAYSGYRVLAYRVSMIYARSGLVAVAAWAASSLSDDKHAPWAVAFGAGAVTMFGLTAFHHLRLPRFEASRDAAFDAMAVLRSYVPAFRSYLDQRRIFLVLVFIIIYRLGDEILFSMVTPFLLRELQVSKGQYAWIAGVVGAAGSIGGAMLGGYWIKVKGLKGAVWPLTLLMNLNIWAYVWLAWSKPDASTTSGIATIAFVHGYEQVAAGLGNASLLMYLLGTCKPEFKAGHYAIGSAIMSLGSTLFGGFGGRIVEAVGYLQLFLIAFVASIPSMALLPFVPMEDRNKAS
ncbi:MAG: MFS transporter [Deltaproteobacteria bacterium]|nr:MFS transporter [Deltaproteobacteria bacterium]